MKRTNKAGFTLIELLVVIGIIAALAGFAITNLGSADKALQLASMKQDVKSAITQAQIADINGNSLKIYTTSLDVTAAQPLAGNVKVLDSNDNLLMTIQVSPNNVMSIKGSVVCKDGTPGYSIVATSAKYDSAKEVGFNSCQDVAPVTAASGSATERQGKA